MSSVLSTLYLLLAASVAGAQTWAPPMGIPMPPIGITEVAGPTTSTTIPAVIQAGAVITVTGNQGDVTVQANCAAKPCYLQGGTFHVLRATGTGLIIEKGTYYNLDVTLDRSALRDFTIVGDKSGGGLYTSGSTNLTVLRFLIRDVGNVNAPTDLDTHGIAAGTTGHHIYILDGEIARTGGDGIQINSWTEPAAGLHHIYIGRVYSHGHRQHPFWVKTAVDVTFSENRGELSRVSDYGSGACLGGQYGAPRLVVIGNRFTDCAYGINMRSGDQPASTLIAGNVITDTYRPAGAPTAAQDIQTQGACMLLMTSGQHRAIFNTCVRVWGGLQVPPGAGPTGFAFNILSDLKDAPITTSGPVVLNAAANLVPPTVPKFASTTDFTLAIDSPAKGKGVANALERAYSDLNGVTYRSVHGVDLPDLGATPDLGAFGPALRPVATSTPVPPPPPSPPVPPPTPPPTPAPRPCRLKLFGICFVH